jgi:hypothetical protein
LSLQARMGRSSTLTKSIGVPVDRHTSDGIFFF